MDIKMHNFPTLRDGRIAIEEKFCELNSRYRNGESLEPEAIDWMDTANNWLNVYTTKL